MKLSKQIKSPTRTDRWFLLTTIFLVVSFLWFCARPSLIRSHCQNWAYKKGNEYFSYDFLINKTSFEKSDLQIKYMDGAYTRCIHEKGLMK